MNVYIWKDVNYLCFTSSEGQGTWIQLSKIGSPTSVSIEYSTDGNNWNSYTFGAYISFPNIGDKVYFRNTSEIDTLFSTSGSDYYQFSISGYTSISGDISCLLNKNLTDTIPDHAFRYLFKDCGYITTPPSLPYINIGQYCYNNMFRSCTNLETLPQLPATELKDYCYGGMFYGCSKIKLSTTQTGDYQTSYRIPTTGSGATASNSLGAMFTNTGGTFTGAPDINTTYYTSNTVV